MSGPQQPGYGPPPGWDPQTGGTGPTGAPGPGAPGPGAPWPGSTGAGQPWPGGQPPQPGPGWGAPETSSKAIVALVLALLAYTVVPFVAAVVALVLAGQARREIRASGGRLTGEGLATAAWWLSVVHLVFVAVVFTVAALFFAVVGVTGFS